MSMACFNQLMGSNQAHMFWRDSMISDKRMTTNDGINVLGMVLLGSDMKFLAILHTAFNENGERRRGSYPMSVVRHSVQPGSIGSGCWYEAVMLEIVAAEP
jgi:hypothetical protein